MTRLGHTGSFLLVEGGDDKKLYASFVDRSRCHVQIAGNKGKVLDALALLDGEGFRGALAIVDADFAILDGQVPTSPNLLFTDTHDLETMLLASPALERVLVERGDEAKITAVCGPGGARARLLELGRPIGYLRWLNARHGQWIRFEDLEMERFIDETRLVLDRDRLLATLRNRSSRAVVVDDDELWRRAESLRDDAHDPWHVCCGHDLVRILSLGLRKALGTNNDAEVKPASLEERLRLAFSEAHFQATKLFTGIVAWEAANAPHVVVTRPAELPWPCPAAR